MSNKLFNGIRVIGHRGACGYAPENTLASMKVAHELGVKWVEFDVVLTKDNVAVILHDETVNRTTNGRGSIAGLTYQQIQTLDAGRWFSKPFAGEKIPTLIELLELLAQYQMGINVEIKPTPGREIETTEMTLDILKKFWPEHCPKPLISSFSTQAITKAREIDANIAIGLLLDTWIPNWQQLAKILNCVSVHTNYKMLNQEIVSSIKQMGGAVLCYTVNEITIAKKLFTWGVDAIFSNYPDKMMNVAKEF